MSQILELYFNAKQGAASNGSVFETVGFKPSTAQEAGLGDFFVFAELRNMPEKARDFLPRLINLLQRGYYDIVQVKTAQDALKNSLDRVNSFLAEIPKKEGFNLGGNLNLLVVSVAPDLIMRLARVGTCKAFLLRDSQIFNVADNLPASRNNLFSNIVESQFKDLDKLILLNRELVAAFEKENILRDLAQVEQLKEIKHLISQRKKILQQVTGASLMVLAKSEKRFFLPAIIKPKPQESGMAGLASFSNKLENNFVFRFFQKILPQSPKLKSIIFKILVSLAALIILLPLGWFLFRYYR